MERFESIVSTLKNWNALSTKGVRFDILGVYVCLYFVAQVGKFIERMQLLVLTLLLLLGQCNEHFLVVSKWLRFTSSKPSGLLLLLMCFQAVQDVQ